MAEHDDRGGRAPGGDGADGREEIVGHLPDRLGGGVLLKHGRRCGVARGDRGDLAGLKPTGRVEQADDRPVCADEDSRSHCVTGAIDEAGKFYDGCESLLVGKHRQPIGMVAAEVEERRLDLSVVFGGGVQL